MLKFRIKLIECVLCSANSMAVEKAILEVVQQEIKKGISKKKIAKIISFLENDMIYEVRLEHTSQELNNIKEALKVLQKSIHINHK
jgi:hypothetical protein